MYFMLSKNCFSKFFTTLFFLYHYCESSSCKFDAYDFTSIGSHEWLAISDTKNVSYKMTLCGSLSHESFSSPCFKNTAVCMTTAAGGSSGGVIVGLSSSNPTFKEDKAKKELWLTFTGLKCSKDSTQEHRVVINFKCGQHLGSPVFVSSYDCQHHFEWYTNTACVDVAKEKEVPCSVHDSRSNKYDLTPLIKSAGAYTVDVAGEREIFINVCRDITPADGAGGCAGKAACLKHGGSYVNLGQPENGVKVAAGDRLELLYTGGDKLAKCFTNSTTRVVFRCPKRGAGRQPLLVSDSNCHYVIEWPTEHACKLSYLTSPTCRLNAEDHDVDIDLTPLAKSPGNRDMYSASVFDKTFGDHYIYYINVCEELGLDCPSADRKKDISGCQRKNNSMQAWSIGKRSTQLMRYVDGELTLTYRGGDTCHTHFHRTTVISFHCDKSAGKGKPVFNRNFNCTYMFDWKTAYACLDHPQDNCQVTDGNRKFDLSPLVKTSGENWHVMKSDSSDQADFYINVCRDLVKNKHTTHCPPDSSVCRKSSSGLKSLGRFSTPPTYNKQLHVIQINYTTNRTCGMGNALVYYSVVNFRCKPGSLESSPVFIRQFGCMYEFEWHTAAACVLSRHTGTGCKVHDDTAGFTYDLSKLTRPSSDPYKITDAAGRYNYYVNVCAPLAGSLCNKRKNPHVGVCQVKIPEKPGSKSDVIHSTGQYNANLTYYDGMINLTYYHGDPYNVKGSKSVLRTTEIAFLCDMSAGAGKPQFVDERDHTYFFKWYTKYACPEPAVECTAIDDKLHKEYDLSSLTVQDGHANWVIVHRKGSSRDAAKYYINVCRAVTTVAGCDRDAAVCAKLISSGKDVVQHANLGKATRGPTVESPGRLLLEYTGGEECHEKVDASGSKRNATTRIHFVCKKGSLSTAPRLESQSNCEYVFLWETEAACPLHHSTDSSSKCRVKDSKLDYTYDFAALTKSGGDAYTVSGNGRTFKLNICGPVKATVCDKISGSTKPTAACEVTSGKKSSLGQVSDHIRITDMGQMYVRYEGAFDGVGTTTVEVYFVCDRLVALGTPKFDNFLYHTYKFTVDTALACPPEPVECVVQDKSGQTYDLSYLSKVDDSWVVEDYKIGKKSRTFHINVCRPIVISGHPLCSGGVAACAIGRTDDVSLGYSQSKPTVSEAGVISIRYRNGSPCNGTAVRTSTTINFDCSAKEYGPVFVEQTASCEYVFLWRTPAACPLHRNTGSDCRVKDTLYNLEFNLSPLTNKTADYVVKGSGARFLINVCAPLVAGKGDCAGGKIGSCEVKLKGDSVTQIGAYNSAPIYEDGQIMLRYRNGHEQSGRKCESRIVFTCDHSKDGADGPVFVNRSANCVYLFEWRTRLACPAAHEVDCKVRDKQGEEYDLSGLSQPGFNYEVVTSTPPNQKYIINVCRTLVHRPGQTCPVKAAACRINMTETDPKKKYHDIGELGPSVISVTKDRILLTYTGGEKCSNGKDSSTVVHLRCNKLAIDTQPSDEYAVDDCTYHVMWDTRAACALSQVATNAGPCKAKNPATGYEFDLSSFKSHTFNFTDSSSYRYFIRICQPFPDHKCQNHVQSGMCQHELKGERRWFSAGDANDHLEYNDHSLVLKYKNGDSYNNEKRTHRETLISFVCREGSGLGHPVLVSESDSTYNILWHTALACEKQVRCSVDNGSSIIDLSPLIKPTGHHLVIPSFWAQNDTGATYYINVCRPLNPIRGTLCPPGSSACRVMQGDRPRDLGKSNAPPYIDKQNGKVTLEYDHGDSCIHLKNKNSRSRIIFSCLPGLSQGMPKLETTTADCTYVFTWQTNVVCPRSKPTAAKDCKFTDQRTNQIFDLSTLRKSDKYYEVAAGNDEVYRVNVCGPVTPSTVDCKDSAVCRLNRKSSQEVSYGRSSAGVFEIRGDALTLTYGDGASCDHGKGKHKTVIYFKCDRNRVGKMSLRRQDDCRTSLDWSVPQACGIKRKPCVFTDGVHVYDLSMLTRDFGMWNVTDSNHNEYWLNICEGVYGGPPGCQNDAVACRRTSGSSKVDMIGMADYHANRTYDNGKTIVLSYGSFYPCKGRMMSKVIFKFTCGNTIGSPVYDTKGSQGDRCIFKFLWKSSAACKIRRVAAVDHNGVIRHDKTGTTFNLHRLMFGINGNYMVEKKVSEETFRYAVSLRGKLVLDSRLGTTCKQAAICEQKLSDATYQRNIATYDSRKYYIEDNQLQVEYEGAHTCGGGKSNVRSIITFHCARFSRDSKVLCIHVM